MRSAANTLLRIVSWVLVILGTLFTIMDAWLVGLPAILVGTIGIFTTNRGSQTEEFTEEDDPKNQTSQSFVSSSENIVNYADIDDPQGPNFLTDEEDR